jgi:hypothetical protein
MPEIELARLRKLRSRAESLVSTLTDDLKPFQSEFLSSGFRRKPDSQSAEDDVNVTTTCSCLMSLAHSGKLREFYKDDTDQVVQSILTNLMNAPWMSSGLTENNAFTTTLMIRLFGSLVQAKVPQPPSALKLPRKAWEQRLSIPKFIDFCKKLCSQAEPFCIFLYQLLPSDIQKKVDNVAKGGKLTKVSESSPSKEEKAVTNALEGLIKAGIFYDKERFAGHTLPENAVKLISSFPCDAYHTAQLNRILLHSFFQEEMEQAKEQSLSEIATNICSEIDNFRINDYPTSAAVIYWCIDGISNAHFDLPVETWTNICRFATEDFYRQRSLVVAQHTAMMDPVAMAMSACLCARLHSIGKGPSSLAVKWNPDSLPSMIELESAVIDLFGKQTDSGLWPKYFPLFHYQDAGSNFCYTFELLEAVLVEFGGKENHLLLKESVIKGLELAVTSCEIDRLEDKIDCLDDNGPKEISPDPGSSSTVTSPTVSYEGWNSGGNLETLRRGQPESWPTAVVHMFLGELVGALSDRVQWSLLERYDATLPSTSAKGLDGMLDISVKLDDRSLKGTLRDSVIKTFSSFRGDLARDLRKDSIRKEAVKDAAISALLFGPPGTSKTQVAKAIAAELRWPLVEIDPSHFLQTAFQNIYVQAERIFEDVMDMCGVVVLFDEMDALVQNRKGSVPSDTESKFLTTYMLPKLLKLHDRGQLIFLMATNFLEEFDDAIKRAGRFDLLLCMGPPTFAAKCDKLHVFLKSSKEARRSGKKSTQTENAGKLLLKFGEEDPFIKYQLELYTYGEFRSFISRLGTIEDIDAKLEKHMSIGLAEEVRKNNANVGFRLDDLQGIKKLRKWKKAKGPLDYRVLEDLDKVDFNEKDLEASKITMTKAIRYALERKQSKSQL